MNDDGWERHDAIDMAADRYVELLEQNERFKAKLVTAERNVRDLVCSAVNANTLLAEARALLMEVERSWDVGIDLQDRVRAFLRRPPHA